MTAVDIVIIVVILTAVGLAVRSMIADRKNGKSSCGGNCSACGICASCTSSEKNGGSLSAGTGG